MIDLLVPIRVSAPRSVLLAAWDFAESWLNADASTAVALTHATVDAVVERVNGDSPLRPLRAVPGPYCLTVEAEVHENTWRALDRMAANSGLTLEQAAASVLWEMVCRDRSGALEAA